MEYSYEEELDCNLEEQEIFDEKLNIELDNILIKFNREEENNNE